MKELYVNDEEINHLNDYYRIKNFIDRNNDDFNWIFFYNLKIGEVVFNKFNYFIHRNNYEKKLIILEELAKTILSNSNFIRKINKYVFKSNKNPNFYCGEDVVIIKKSHLHDTKGFLKNLAIKKDVPKFNFGSEIDILNSIKDSKFFTKFKMGYCYFKIFHNRIDITTPIANLNYHSFQEQLDDFVEGLEYLKINQKKFFDRVIFEYKKYLIDNL